MKNGSVIDISDEEVYRLTNDRSEKNKRYSRSDNSRTNEF